MMISIFGCPEKTLFWHPKLLPRQNSNDSSGDQLKFENV